MIALRWADVNFSRVVLFSTIASYFLRFSAVNTAMSCDTSAV